MTALGGVDVGGSGIRAVISSAGEERRGAVDGAVHLGSSIDTVALAHAIVTILDGLGTPPPEVVCIGMTGFPGLVDDPEHIAGRVMSATAVKTVIVAGDSLTTHVGALSMRAGIVIAAGTGVIALGTDHRSRWNRVDGWGHLLGDEGSGAWIGRAGLAAGMRAHDGRGGSSVLLNALIAEYGDLPALLRSVYEGGAPAHELARFAPVVAQASREGDPIALSIWRDAARHLAETAVAAADGLEPLYSWGGGLLQRDDLLLQPFKEFVIERQPDARFHPPAGGSLEGALRLAESFDSGHDPTASEYLRVYER